MYLFRKSRAKQRARESLMQLAKQGRVLPPSAQVTEPCSYISIPALDIPGLADAYIAAMETQNTNDWCRCEWIIHPDDVNVSANHCRECGEKKEHDVHFSQYGEHDFMRHYFRGKRMRRGDQAPDCPVHTKEGLIIYFFEWVFTRGKN